MIEYPDVFLLLKLYCHFELLEDPSMHRAILCASVFRKHCKFECLMTQYRQCVTVTPVLQSLPIPDDVLEDDTVLQNAVKVEGWISGIRKNKEVCFIDLTDGISRQKLQVLIPSYQHKTIRGLSWGSAISVSGTFVKSPGTKQQLELKAENIEVLGALNLNKFPLKPKVEYSSNFLRRHLSVRPKTRSFSAFLRVRSMATRILHQYFEERDFVLIHTPVITANDCEGAGENFSVTAFDEAPNNSCQPSASSDTTVNYAEDAYPGFFGNPAYLSVSGQLHLEIAASALCRVYCFGPAFRAEKSLTRQHLAEFYMLEAELAFVNDLNTLMNLVEDCVQNLAKKLLDLCPEDLTALRRFHAKENDKQFTGAIDLIASGADFVRMDYKEALSVLGKNSKKLDDRVSEKRELTKEHEQFLVRHCNGVPVLVTEFPSEQKPLYMKRTADGERMLYITNIIFLALCFDLLGPAVGELCGGSLRETDFKKLQTRLKQHKQMNQLQWYLELKEFGDAPHGGFGIGFERLLQCLLGIRNIKDCLPFPRWYKSCSL